MNNCICKTYAMWGSHSPSCDAHRFFGSQTFSARLTPDEQRRMNYPLGVGDVRVARLDGTESDPFIGIRYDANRMENGFLVMEDQEDNIYHVANVDYWVVI